MEATFKLTRKRRRGEALSKALATGKGPIRDRDEPTEFDKMMRYLNLTEETARFSAPLRVWALKNKSVHYIPEELLDIWNLEVREFDCFGSGVTSTKPAHGARVFMSEAMA